MTDDVQQALQAALASLLEAHSGAEMARNARALSERYRLRTGAGARLLTREDEAVAYAAARMPATSAAACAALGEALACSGVSPRTLLDCGAGTGAVTFAAHALLPLEETLCLEREAAMRSVGQRLMQACGGALASVRWDAWDLAKGEALPQAELVCEGYMLGELSQAQRVPVAVRLWEAARQMLLLIEPGTPQGAANLSAVRRELTARGAYVAAPCPSGMADCPLAGENWCHFAVRVQRTKLHKALKGGDAPYEDEKFCYLALTRTPPASACTARVLRHPQIAPGRIALSVCEAGHETQRVVTKKDPLWKRARKTRWGDGW